MFIKPFCGIAEDYGIVIKTQTRMPQIQPKSRSSQGLSELHSLYFPRACNATRKAAPTEKQQFLIRTQGMSEQERERLREKEQDDDIDH